MSQVSQDTVRMDPTERLEDIRRKKEQVVRMFVKQTEVLEMELGEACKDLCTMLRKHYLKSGSETIAKSLTTAEAQIFELKKLKTILSNMDKLLADFRRSSSSLFEGVDLHCGKGAEVEEDCHDLSGNEDEVGAERQEQESDGEEQEYDEEEKTAVVEEMEGEQM